MAKDNITNQEIIKIAEENMPKYMVPKIYISVSEMPLTVNRKIDTKKLIDIYKNTISNYRETTFNEEKDEIKLQVREIVKQVLNIEEISDDTNLFTLGMDSLIIIEIIIQLESKFNIELPDDFIYLNQNISSITNYLSTKFITNTNINKIKSLESNTINKEIIKEYIDRLNDHITSKKILRKYDTHYLQKVYYYDNFESFISINIDIPIEYKLDDIILTLTKLINRHELFRSVLIEEPKLCFYEYDKIDNIKDIVLITNKDAQNQVNDMIEEILTQSKKNNILYMPYIILSKESTRLCIVASHKIMDQKSVHIFKKDFYDLLMNKNLDEPMEYCKFVDFSKKINNDYDFSSDAYVNKLLSIKKHGFENYGDDKILCKNFEVKRFKEAERTLIWIINRILKFICKYIQTDSLISSTILNFRKFKDLDFTRSVGDYHTAIVFPYTISISDDDMENELNLIFDK